MVNASDIWTEYDKKEFVTFVNILIKLKIFKLKRHGMNSRTKLTRVGIADNKIVAHWETKY